MGLSKREIGAVRLATLNDGTRDGRLTVVSPDGNAFAFAPAKTLQEALENWDTVAPDLAAFSDFPEILDPALIMAPLPRAWQWLDGSVYSSHGALMDKVLGIESRGFIFAAPLADRLGAGLVPVRKLGRLPAETVRAEYALEYGTNTVEMHRDAIAPGERILVVDDLLATGGTCRAAIDLVEQVGGKVVACAFLIELLFLDGRANLQGHNVEALISY